MQNITPNELEKKFQQVLDRKKDELYREFRDRMGGGFTVIISILITLLNYVLR